MTKLEQAWGRTVTAASRQNVGSDYIRRHYFQMLDGFNGLEQAVMRDVVTGRDQEFDRWLRLLKGAIRKVSLHMDRNYNWD